MTIMDRAVIAKESSSRVNSQGSARREDAVARKRGSFARGVMYAAPVALALWALIFWLVV